MADLSPLQNIFGGGTPPAPANAGSSRKGVSSLQNIFPASPTIPSVPKLNAPISYWADTKNGTSFGPSPLKDVSGKPFLDYKAPGSTSTTTDKTRVDTTFDPTVASPQKSFTTPRMSQSQSSSLKNIFGGTSSQELDHTQPLELAGSNDPSNLRLENNIPGTKNTPTDPAENSLAHDVITGKKSLFQAQTEMAAIKKTPAPFTGQKAPSIMDRLTGSIHNVLSAVSNLWSGKIAPAIDRLTQEPAEGSASSKTTLGNLPSSIVENLPVIGPLIKEVRDNPESAKYLTPANVIKSLPAAGQDFIKGFIAQPVLTIAGATLTPLWDKADKTNGMIHFNIPGIGEVSNLQYDIAKQWQGGENPWAVGGTALLQGTPGAIFTSLFAAGLFERAFSPQETVISKNSMTQEESGIKPTESPKSFRLYNKPVATAPISDAAVQKMASEKGFQIPKGYNPAEPTFFRLTTSGSGKIVGELVQIKPGFADQFINMFKGDASQVPEEGIVPIMEKSTTLKALSDSVVEKTTPKPVASASPLAPSDKGQTPAQKQETTPLAPESKSESSLKPNSTKVQLPNKLLPESSSKATTSTDKGQPKLSTPQLEKNTPRKTADTKGGFVDLGKAGEDIKAAADRVAKYIEARSKAVKFATDLDQTLYNLKKNAEADSIEPEKLTKSLKDVLLPREWENIFHYREELTAGTTPRELTPKEKAVNDHIITPLNEDANKMRAELKKHGVELPSEAGNSRIVKNRGNIVDRMIAGKDKLFSSTPSGKKNLLKQSAPTLKKRVYHVAVDKDGNRTVVAIKHGEVTGYRNKVKTPMGKLKAKVTPKFKEFNDEKVTNVLEKLAKDLGIKHERVTGRSKGLGHSTAGVSFKGQKLIKTRAGAPERVLLHEIGHQLDEKYDLQKLFSHDDNRNFGKDTSKAELRALADLSFEGTKVSKYFKTYARKGGEKMAMMFEAYLHAPEKFQAVAPNIFEKFEEFLRSQPELKPILDLNPSLVLQKQTFGGEHVGGLKGDTFIGKDGTKYTVGQATPEEIEKHTSTTYYHNPLVSALISGHDLQLAHRAIQTLETLKTSPEFKDHFYKTGDPGELPEGWQPINLDQFRGYYADPKNARVLNTFAKDLRSSKPNILIGALTAMNNFALSVTFMTPIGHLINVGAGAVINRGVSGWLNPLAYPRLARTTIAAIRAITTQNDTYIKMLRAGAPLMAAGDSAAHLQDNLLNIMGEKGSPQKQMVDKSKKIASFLPPMWTHKLTWPGNDIIVMQQILETMEKSGMSAEDAIADVSKMLPDYRLPASIGIMGKPAIRNTTAFLTYHVNLIQNFMHTGKDLLLGTSEKGDWTWHNDSESYKSRAKALDKVAMMALVGWVIMPLINDAIKKLVKNPNAHLHSPGPLAIIDNLNKLAYGEMDWGDWVQTIITPAIATKEIIEQLINLDPFTGNKIRQPGTSFGEKVKASAQHAETALSPLDQYNKLQGGQITPSQFFESFLAISSPKSSANLSILNSLVNDGRRNVLTRAKALRTQGDKAGAQKLIDDFNANLQKALDRVRSEQGKLPKEITSKSLKISGKIKPKKASPLQKALK